MKQRGFRYCSGCKNKLQKRGKTAANKQRWYCMRCDASATKPRLDLRRRFVFELFFTWLLGKNSQHELDGPARSFRDQTTWCWDVPIPYALTGEIHYVIIIDGICIGNQVCLIARTVHHVIAWVWVDRENSANWSALLNLLPEPAYVVCDGQKGMLKALAICWPQAIVQRCRFHVWLNVKKKLTLHPESRAGQDLLVITRKLLHVRTRRQARRWKRQLKRWYGKHRNYINERTVIQEPQPRKRTWRYTHERLRSAHRQLVRQSDDLLRSSYRANPKLPSTTKHVEGGINSQIRTKLSNHRGMKNEHQMVLVNWYLYTRTEGQKPPRFCL